MEFCGIVRGMVECNRKCRECRISKEYEEMQEDFLDMACEEAGIINAMINAGW